MILRGGWDGKGALGDFWGGLVTFGFVICVLAGWLCSLRENALSWVLPTCALPALCGFFH